MLFFNIFALRMMLRHSPYHSFHLFSHSDHFLLSSVIHPLSHKITQWTMPKQRRGMWFKHPCGLSDNQRKGARLDAWSSMVNGLVQRGLVSMAIRVKIAKTTKKYFRMEGKKLYFFGHFGFPWVGKRERTHSNIIMERCGCAIGESIKGRWTLFRRLKWRELSKENL
mgnify:CR=1 FL=1